MGDVDTAPDATSRAREADAPRNSQVAGSALTGR